MFTLLREKSGDVYDNIDQIIQNAFDATSLGEPTKITISTQMGYVMVEDRGHCSKKRYHLSNYLVVLGVKGWPPFFSNSNADISLSSLEFIIFSIGVISSLGCCCCDCDCDCGCGCVVCCV